MQFPSVLCGLVLSLTPVVQAGFLDGLSAEQKTRLGLDHLTPAQATAIDEAVERYKGGEVTALKQQAAAQAVADYKAKQEPVVVAQAVDSYKQQQKSAPGPGNERIACHIQGSFTGWSGHTLFTLDNGQVWRQAGSEVYVVPAVEDAIVEIRKAPSGYYRLYLSDGRWITVQRVR